MVKFFENPLSNKDHLRHRTWRTDLKHDEARVLMLDQDPR